MARHSNKTIDVTKVVKSPPRTEKVQRRSGPKGQVAIKPRAKK